jgi:hypothetical protein
LPNRAVFFLLLDEYAFSVIGDTPDGAGGAGAGDGGGVEWGISTLLQATSPDWGDQSVNNGARPSQKRLADRSHSAASDQATFPARCAVGVYLADAAVCYKVGPERDFGVPTGGSSRRKEKGEAMRFLLIASMSTETANEVVRSGRIGQVMQKTLQQLKPEAAYFGPGNGVRTAYLVVNVDDVSQIPAISEPFFQEVGAKVEFIPVMTVEDLTKGLAALQQGG